MVDVLVIGGGLAGWRAAEAAVAAGCSVTLVANGSGNSPEIHALNVPAGAVTFRVTPVWFFHKGDPIQG